MRRLLIVGFGDIAARASRQLTRRYQVSALVRTEASASRARALGVRPLCADLDDQCSLERLVGAVDAVLYCAPPPGTGQTDPRVRRLLAALGKANSIPRRLVYISTSAVYGNAPHGLTDETRPPCPAHARARRRLDAERTLRAYACCHGASLAILRAPGIYAADRLPIQRLRDGLPVVRAEEDGWSNRIHADDLAALCVAALERQGGIRVYNASDDSALKHGEWLGLVADAIGLPPPPALPRDEAAALLGAQRFSFMADSRRLCNRRIKQELAVRLAWPDGRTFLASVGRIR
ncbi:NAD(P)H-binding protein [Crenobacter caeni]|uniref:NAD(P)H-binding protein n=1 Tax=Crenobacter caeni TaxID=2705474 RepID=A0A6B2KQ66_9NEIS|nr:NAD(P)H-binding protein [Crenobacter caeni]NDV12047.1 NAD(P)H-binding protein [Crenobacter caeni]